MKPLSTIKITHHVYILTPPALLLRNHSPVKLGRLLGPVKGQGQRSIIEGAPVRRTEGSCHGIQFLRKRGREEVSAQAQDQMVIDRRLTIEPWPDLRPLLLECGNVSLVLQRKRDLIQSVDEAVLPELVDLEGELLAV